MKAVSAIVDVFTDTNHCFSLYKLSKEANLKEDSYKRQPIDHEDGDSLFCRSLSARLKNLPGRTKAYVRLQIEQLFYQVESTMISQLVDVSAVPQPVVPQCIIQPDVSDQFQQQQHQQQLNQQQQPKYFDLA